MRKKNERGTKRKREKKKKKKKNKEGKKMSHIDPDSPTPGPLPPTRGRDKVPLRLCPSRYGCFATR